MALVLLSSSLFACAGEVNDTNEPADETAASSQETLGTTSQALTKTVPFLGAQDLPWSDYQITSGTESDDAPFIGWRGEQQTVFGMPYYATALYLRGVKGWVNHGSARLSWGNYRASHDGTVTMAFRNANVVVEG